ncbi:MULTISPECIES: APC family permease [Arthrobacter]|uniref:APC family permease n=1 Tax=Arthrobacter terricola TaxID=2547396 RepID=A0A4R5K6Q7_9MICC|nr:MULTISPECIES: amino acid permease [Arthrobacter]TDF89154.1 APC family permease [Arthrobacter terricola]
MDQPSHSTRLAQEQSKHLQKSLGRFDILLLVVAAVISVEVLGQVSGFGGETFTWALILAVTFMVPYGLIFAETGGAFTEEGGVYVWTKMAFGRVVAAITALFTWVTQPVWVGGAMAFVAVETWSEYVSHVDTGSVGDYLFKLLFIWITVTSAVISLKHGKWLPSLGAILLVVPLDQINGISGLFGAVSKVYSVFGPAAPAMLAISAIVFCFVLVSQGAAWMIISDRMQAMAAADGSFFGGFFGRFHPKLGTPIRVNTLSGVVATLFMLAAMQLSGTSSALFGVVLSIAISTFLLSYLLAMPAAVRLRRKYPLVERPFKVPVSDTGFRILGAICFAWILIGSWVAIFPGTLEKLFNVDYDFEATWGVSQMTFEAFALGTLGCILALGIVGYIRGKKVRDAPPAADPDAESLCTDRTPQNAS